MEKIQSESDSKKYRRVSFLPRQEVDVYSEVNNNDTPHNGHCYTDRPPPEKRLLIRIPRSLNESKDECLPEAKRLAKLRGGRYLVQSFGTLQYWVFEWGT